MTVSPAMWVTGNMASNMSLKKKETDGRGRREKERGRKNTVITKIVDSLTNRQTTRVSSVEEQHDGKDSQLNSPFSISTPTTGTIAKGMGLTILDDPKHTHTNLHKTHPLECVHN